MIQINPEGPSGNQGIVAGAIEVAGLGTPPASDAWGSSLVGAAGATTATTDQPTSQPRALAVGVLSMRSNHTNMLITPEVTWTEHHEHQNNASGPPGHSMVSRVLTEAGVVSHTWTHQVPSRGAAAIIATFVAAQQN